MCDNLIHRGPDEEGIFDEKNIGLGIRRLSIIDVNGGKQPISNETQDIWTSVLNKKEYEIFSEMAQEEKEHLDYFNNLAKQINIKPSKLAPLFDIGAFAMGVGTALMGPKAAYVCTEAVEEVIEQHYNKQIDQLDKIDTEKTFLYIDVGGGSTEISILKGGKRLNSNSFKIGTVRLLNKDFDHRIWNQLEIWVKKHTKISIL